MIHQVFHESSSFSWIKYDSYVENWVFHDSPSFSWFTKFFMNHEVYCFQIKIPTRRFWAHKKVVSRKKETFLVKERVITNIGNYKHIARIFKLHKRFHGATEPIQNATGGILRTESHIFCSHNVTLVLPRRPRAPRACSQEYCQLLQPRAELLVRGYSRALPQLHRNRPSGTIYCHPAPSQKVSATSRGIRDQRGKAPLGWVLSIIRSCCTTANFSHFFVFQTRTSTKRKKTGTKKGGNGLTSTTTTMTTTKESCQKKTPLLHLARQARLQLLHPKRPHHSLSPASRRTWRPCQWQPGPASLSPSTSTTGTSSARLRWPISKMGHAKSTYDYLVNTQVVENFNVAVSEDSLSWKLQVKIPRAHQKRYYAPFMGYKFIAYLCPWG